MADGVSEGAPDGVEGIVTGQLNNRLQNRLVKIQNYRSLALECVQHELHCPTTDKPPGTKNIVHCGKQKSGELSS